MNVYFGHNYQMLVILNAKKKMQVKNVDIYVFLTDLLRLYLLLLLLLGQLLLHPVYLHDHK